MQLLQFRNCVLPQRDNISINCAALVCGLNLPSKRAKCRWDQNIFRNHFLRTEQGKEFTKVESLWRLLTPLWEVTRSVFLIKLLFSVYYLIWEVPVVKKHAYFFIYYTFFISGIPVCHSGPCQYDVWWTPRNKSDLIYCNLSSIVSPFNFIVCRENNAEFPMIPLFFPASWYPFAKLFASTVALQQRSLTTWPLEHHDFSRNNHKLTSSMWRQQQYKDVKRVSHLWLKCSLQGAKRPSGRNHRLDTRHWGRWVLWEELPRHRHRNR